MYFEQSASTINRETAYYYYEGGTRHGNLIASRQGVTIEGDTGDSYDYNLRSIDYSDSTFVKWSRITAISRVLAQIGSDCTGYGYVRIPIGLGVNGTQGSFTSEAACSVFLDFYISNNVISELSVTKCTDGSDIVGKYWTAQSYSEAFEYSPIHLPYSLFTNPSLFQISSVPFD